MKAEVIKDIQTLKREIITLALEDNRGSVQSNISESKYHNTKWGQVRVSGHNYPTGDMTNAPMRVFDTFYLNGVIELARAMSMNDKANELATLNNKLWDIAEAEKLQERNDRFEKARATILRGTNTSEAYGDGITIFYTTKEARVAFRASCGDFDNRLPFVYIKITK